MLGSKMLKLEDRKAAPILVCVPSFILLKIGIFKTMLLSVISPTADILGDPTAPHNISQNDSQLLYGEQFLVEETARRLRLRVTAFWMVTRAMSGVNSSSKIRLKQT